MKLFIVALYFFVILTTIVYPQEIFSGFSKDATSSPPLLPSKLEDNLVNIVLNLESGEQLIKNTHALISIRNFDTDEQAGGLYYTQQGSISFSLIPGRWIGLLGIDEATTLGSDYYANIDINVEDPTTITPTLIAVGSISGEVYDSKNRLVSNAKIKVDCKQYIASDVVSDDFGIFFAEYLAPGECRLAAVSDKDIGFATVSILPGDVTTVRIMLDKKIAEQSRIWYFIAIALIVMFALIIYIGRPSIRISPKIVKHKKKEPEPKAEIPSVLAEPTKDARIQDIIKTLKGRETAVVEFLLQNNNESTQAKILYGTNIPKTSLARVFETLTQRNIVVVQKMGKAKKIRLSDWLLGKDLQKQG